jgi:hypothetical protein
MTTVSADAKAESARKSWFRFLRKDVDEIRVALVSSMKKNLAGHAGFFILGLLYGCI